VKQLFGTTAPTDMELGIKTAIDIFRDGLHDLSGQ
jgi:hypothetical protein